MKLLIPVVIVLFTSLACSKDKDTQNPVLTVNTPTLGQVFNNGDPINITGTASDDKVIHELYVILSNAITSAVIIEFQASPGIPSTSFNYQVAASSGIHYRLQVVVKDKVRNDARKTIEFTCN